MNTTTKKKRPKPYRISLTLNGTTLTGEGTTALEALQQIKRPVKIVTKGKLTITNGETEREVMLMPVNLKRLFYPSAQSFLAKRFSFGMK